MTTGLPPIGKAKRKSEKPQAKDTPVPEAQLLPKRSSGPEPKQEFGHQRKKPRGQSVTESVLQERSADFRRLADRIEQVAMDAMPYRRSFPYIQQAARLIHRSARDGCLRHPTPGEIARAMWATRREIRMPGQRDPDVLMHRAVQFLNLLIDKHLIAIPGKQASYPVRIEPGGMVHINTLGMDEAQRNDWWRDRLRTYADACRVLEALVGDPLRNSAQDHAFRETPPPPTSLEEAVLNVIRAHPGGITGRAIIEQVSRETSTSTEPYFLDQAALTSRIIPRLKRWYGVENRRNGVGYYISSSQL